MRRQALGSEATSPNRMTSIARAVLILERQD